MGTFEIFDRIKQRVDFGQLLPSCRSDPLVVEKGTAGSRDGEPAAGEQLVEGYTIQVAAMTSADACG